MTNPQLIQELDAARAHLEACTTAFETADQAGTLTAQIELDFLQAETDLRQLMNEVTYRLNWEPRR